jgi:hypothetical protein
MKFSPNSVEAQSAPFIRVDACHAFDGDPAKCNSAFESGLGWDSAYIAPTSCFYHGGRCWPCSEYTFENSGACVNECNPPLCANTPTRKFIGDNCTYIMDQATCEASFKGFGGGDYEAQSCYWNGTCQGCSSDDQIDGKCTNVCTPLPTCSGRATLVKSCAALGTQGACEAAYHLSSEPGSTYPESCYWDTTGSMCHDCSLTAQFAQKLCTNACN